MLPFKATPPVPVAMEREPPPVLLMVDPMIASDVARRERLLLELHPMELRTVILPPFGVGSTLKFVAVLTTTLPEPRAVLSVPKFRLDAPPLSLASWNGEEAVMSQSPAPLMVMSAAPCSNCAERAKNKKERRNFFDGFICVWE